MKEIIISLPFPPSVNAMWRSINGRTILSKKGREYRQFAVAILEGTVEIENMITDKVSVKLVLQPPTARKFDIDNFTKAIFDALTHAKIWEDDELVYHMEIFKGKKIEGGLAVLTIKPWEDKDEN